MHYQFETIHPFLDGNGRIGRLLIVLMLMQEKRLDRPILYVSGYLEANRREYYDRLQGVRESGDIQSWIRFFCAAVQRQSEDGVERAARLVAIREELLGEAQTVRSRLSVIVDLVFRNPFITVRRVQLATGHTEQGARNLIKQAEARGWLESVGNFGRGGRAYWVAERVFSVMQAPATYDSDDYESTQAAIDAD